ncbi:glutamate--cysteine ligase [Actinopolymorpha sp. NPDC004070]|uniref:carboxylate-amine ligase n=1 Tax=Actinopolymorpha sp. NPDC004070 TaxID=3154548 RepID=UPI0033AFD968
MDFETVGVEEEFLLVDPASRLPVPLSVEVLDTALAGGVPTGASFQPELVRTQVETATGVCGDMSTVAEHLRALRGTLGAAARTHDARLVSVGNPVLSGGPPPLTPGERFDRIHRQYAEIVDSYQACGCHVHVGLPDRETAVAVLNHLRPWLPTLLALSANSALTDGRDTGYASWRMVTQARFPGAGIPPYFPSVTAYDREVARLVDCGVLVDADMTFWLARPSPRYATLEVRAADTAGTVDDALLQAALTRALVRTARADLAAGRDAPEVHEQVAAAAMWSAARHGLDGPAVDPLLGKQVPAKDLLHQMLVRVRPALEETGDLPLVRRQVHRVLTAGTSAARQRATYAQAREWRAVVDMLVAQTAQTTQTIHTARTAETGALPAPFVADALG